MQDTIGPGCNPPTARWLKWLEVTAFAMGMLIGIAALAAPLWMNNETRPLMLSGPGDLELSYARGELTIDGQLPHDGWTASILRSEHDPERNRQHVVLRLYEDDPLRRLTEDGKPPAPVPFHLMVPTPAVGQIFLSRVVD